MNETNEKPISHTMNLNFNPRYYSEGQMEKSHFMETFKGEKEEPTDKVYFRKKDEMVDYAEHSFKSQIIMRGNASFNPPSTKK